uniref:Uncharacterized protein n=1 Tax=Chromera velia CCMP2878 TaxID=1169474 RepID=A0A0G4HNL8_9ALVE|eukprot:Cvel_29538.t1-p1 / transcript=Cvel_29538.t1 / gene=Cvel_29538 / organism=Chromera_velia_CCMP2878 / gene_product=hypothetical protein / transcript_product=hypothetical protein / location=Cvel_scaffold4059:6627-7794(+) / protein_length=175 / sequence_SO=supercontig / SO=protein_coding / is_pseudo=false
MSQKKTQFNRGRASASARGSISEDEVQQHAQLDGIGAGKRGGRGGSGRGRANSQTAKRNSSTGSRGRRGGKGQGKDGQLREENHNPSESPIVPPPVSALDVHVSTFLEKVQQAPARLAAMPKIFEDADPVTENSEAVSCGRGGVQRGEKRGNADVDGHMKTEEGKTSAPGAISPT